MKSPNKIIAFLLCSMALFSCTKSVNEKCYSCKKTISHTSKTKVGNEANGTILTTTFEKCFTSQAELQGYENSQFAYSIVGDSIFSAGVDCK